MNLSELAGAMDGELLADPDAGVEEAIIDSRKAREGCLFFALKGSRTDGHRYAADVVAEGGYAVVARPVVDRGIVLVDDVGEALMRAGAWARERFDCPVLGITGSSGKTTTRELLAAGLRQRYKVGVTRRNLNNQLGLPLTLLNTDPRVEVLVLEMGMNHPGELDALGAVARPTASLVTNVGTAHMEFFSDRNQIAAAKSELLKRTRREGFCVIPVGEPVLERAAAERDLSVLRAGPGGDLWVEGNQRGYRLQPVDMAIRLSLEGEHNYQNAVVALLACDRMGVPLEDSLRAMAGYEGMPGRGRVLDAGGVRIMDESYNANPESTIACLGTLAENVRDGGEGIAVLGTMLELGERASSYHRDVLEFADRLGLKLVVLVGELYPKVSDALSRTQFVSAGNPEEAAGQVLRSVQPGDVVLVKGSHSLGLERAVSELVSGIGAES